MNKIFAYLDKHRKYILIALAVFMGLMVLRWLVIDHYAGRLFSYFRNFDKVQEQPINASGKDQQEEQGVVKAFAWIEPYIDELEKMRQEVMRSLPGYTDSPHQIFIQERIDEQYRAVGKVLNPMYADEARLESYEIVKPYAELMDKGLNHLLKCEVDVEAGVQAELDKIKKISEKLERIKERIGALLLRKVLTQDEQEELNKLQSAIDSFDHRELIDDRDILLEKVFNKQSVCRDDIKTLWPKLAKDKEYIREYMPLLSRHNIEEYYYIIDKM
jgi:hypothetical protein